MIDSDRLISAAGRNEEGAIERAVRPKRVAA